MIFISLKCGSCIIENHAKEKHQSTSSRYASRKAVAFIAECLLFHDSLTEAERGSSLMEFCKLHKEIFSEVWNPSIHEKWKNEVGKRYQLRGCQTRRVVMEIDPVRFCHVLLYTSNVCVTFLIYYCCCQIVAFTGDDGWESKKWWYLVGSRAHPEYAVDTVYDTYIYCFSLVLQEMVEGNYGWKKSRGRRCSFWRK